VVEKERAFGVMTFDVFISYPHQDKATADAACAKLESEGIRCWIASRDISPGTDWSEAIVNAIRLAKIMVLIFSGHANTSQQVKREVERAVNKGIPIIPMRIEDTIPSEALEYFISTPHWLDALTPPLEQHLDKLGASVKALLSAGDSKASQEDHARTDPREHAGPPGVTTAGGQNRQPASAARKTLVFLSEGGTCRDPMAKAIATKLFEDRSPTSNVVIHAVGHNPTHKSGASHAARTVIREMYGKDLLADHKPEPLTETLARQADLILVMDESLLERRKTRLPGWPFEDQGKVYTLKNLFKLKEDIDDPWPDGKDEATLSRYRKCAKKLQRILSGNFDQLIRHLEIVE
jgi:protein-tyrosine-phosphatase